MHSFRPDTVFRSQLYSLVLGVALVTVACNGTPPSSNAGGQAPASNVEIVSLHPSEAYAGETFNVQPDGSSALAVRCQNATKETQILFGGQELPTAFGGPELLTAEVPARLTEKEGPLQVVLRTPSGQSKPAVFTVLKR